MHSARRQVNLRLHGWRLPCVPSFHMTEKALARIEAPNIKLKRFHAGDDLMRFLKALQLCKLPRAPVRPLIQQTAVPGGALLRIVQSYA